MRRLILVPLLCLALVPPALAADPGAKTWALAAIRLVTSQGLMGGDETTFRPDSTLTAGTLAQLEADLTQQQPVEPALPAATVTMAGLDAGLVQALGLGDAAAEFAAGVQAAGLKPPSRFGTEVVARLLGLRTNHPAAQDNLELLPNDPATRAEAAYSAAKILPFDGSEGGGVAEAALGFQLPALTAWQQKILRTAVSFIGYPYVWGGTSEKPEAPFGVQARGGFDCSGFVWRVYKLEAYPGAPQLAGVLRGRTTMAMSGEVPESERIALSDLQPADVVFFGAKGPLSKPGQIDHAGIYVGSGWFIHSSEFGVALTQLDGWYADRFAWGRRPLSEAGLG